MKLTAKGIRGLQLPEGKMDHLFWDDDIPGFGLRLRAGGSRSPQELGEIVGIDLADPGFWDAGLDIVERQVDAAEQATRDTGRL